MNLNEALQIAITHHHAGRLGKAREIYQQILSVDPENADTNHLLGIVAHKEGMSDTALELIAKAIKKESKQSIFYNSQGNIFRSLKRWDESIQAYSQALQITPDYPEALKNLANTLTEMHVPEKAIQTYKKILEINPKLAKVHIALGNAYKETNKPDDAVRSYKNALRAEPDSVEAFFYLGNIFQDMGRDKEAIKALETAISLDASFSKAHNNLGLIFHDQGKLDKAARSYKKALELEPGYLEALTNLGSVYHEQEKFDDAVSAYKKVLQIKPDYVEALYNLGNVLQKMNSLNEAVNTYNNVLMIVPNHPKTLNNLGTALLDQGKQAEAMKCLEQALKINPDYAEAQFNLGNVLKTQGEVEKAMKAYIHGLSIKPDYAEGHNNLGNAFKDQGYLDKANHSYRKALSLKPRFSMAHSNLLFTLNYLPGASQKEIYRESLNWDKLHARSLFKDQPYKNSLEREKKLRIGYVSPDFKNHSVAYFIEPLLKAHDRNKVEVFCYANVKKPDEVSNRIRQSADHWVSIVALNDESASEIIRNDAIDILIDLAGHTADNRLLTFAYRPAPIQITWLGYPNTTGMQAVDYRLTDIIADPAGGADNMHSERLIRLPQGFLCYQPEASAPDILPPPSLTNKYITFGSFNNLPKINLEVIQLWSRILKKSPSSRLILKCRQLTDQHISRNLMQLFKNEGIEPNRLSLYQRLKSKTEHLGLYNKIDICLDPFPYNGTTTTCEALWMGVPVITLQGERHAGRVGASILHWTGLTDLLLAKDRDDYLEKTLNLANNIDQLTDLRKDLRRMMQVSPLCSPKTFAHIIEETFCNIWEQYLSQQQID